MPDDPPLPGATRLPDGAWVRGRGIRKPPPPGPQPTYGLYLGVDYAPVWPHDRLDWPDFRLPRDRVRAAALIRHAHQAALAGGRVEIACAGGHGRTGTVIAALAILSGVAPADAVSWAREHYDRHAVETPWQRRWVRRRFPSL